MSRARRMASRSRIDWKGMRPAARRRSAARVPSRTSAQGLTRVPPSSVLSKDRGRSVRSKAKRSAVEPALGVERAAEQDRQREGRVPPEIGGVGRRHGEFLEREGFDRDAFSGRMVRATGSGAERGRGRGPRCCGGGRTSPHRRGESTSRPGRESRRENHSPRSADWPRRGTERRRGGRSDRVARGGRYPAGMGRK